MVQSKVITTIEQPTEEHESNKSRYHLVPTTYYNPTWREYTSSGNQLLWIQQSKSLNCSANTSMHRETGMTWMPMHHVVSLYVVYSSTPPPESSLDCKVAHLSQDEEIEWGRINRNVYMCHFTVCFSIAIFHPLFMVWITFYTEI